MELLARESYNQKIENSRFGHLNIFLLDFT